VADSTRVLVTGGAGFIGSHVVDVLVDAGYAVGVLDLLTTGSMDNVNAAATFFNADIEDGEEVSRIFADFRPGVVDHHAARISVTASARDPVADAHTNVLGTLRILQACREHAVEHLVFASTGGALYGEAEHVPADENTPILPLSPYGAAKASVETYLRTYRATWGLSFTALRYANVYGPRQNAEGEAGVIAIFADRMLRAEEPTVFGDGEQQRDFVYVGDVASANQLAVERRFQGSYNVGTGTATSVNEIVAALRGSCGYGGRVEYAPAREGEVRCITLDSSLLARTAGWSPSVALGDGLALTVDDRRRRF
jgi:UDP-glucose 4-epimerase